MLVSAINSDNRIIHDGAPVASKPNRPKLDMVVLAGGSNPAAGLAKSGSIPGGVINLQTDGTLELNDWSLVTGSKYLTAGQTYRLTGEAGRMTTSGSGQVIGLAVSHQQLVIQLGSGSGSTGSTASRSLETETAERVEADKALASQIVGVSNQVVEESIARTSAESIMQDEITTLQEQVAMLMDIIFPPST